MHRIPLLARIGINDDGFGGDLRQLAEDGLGQEAAYELISSELLLDGSARLNLATFVTTWMPSRAERLMRDTVAKNMIDKDEYPQTAEIERRCVHILSDLWHAPESAEPVGCSAIGSSEACMLGGMAAKWRWTPGGESTSNLPPRPAS